MTDKFESFQGGLTGPITNVEEIDFDPADQTFANTTRALYLSTGGTLALRLSGMDADVSMALAAGWHPLRVTIIRNAGSSAAVGFGCW